MSQWQDISTAPKDGTWIMLFCRFEEGDEYRVCRFVRDDRPVSRHGEFGPFIWSTYDSPPNRGVIAEKVPTHWMPLPAPPASPSQMVGAE